MICINC